MSKHLKLFKETSDGKVTTLDVNGVELSRDGLRAVDSGIFLCPSTVAVNEGNIVKFVSDIADTTFLRSAYLFQGSCLDEGGYNVDPINQVNVPTSGWADYDGLEYDTASANKFAGFYQAYVNASNKGAILQNKFLPDGSPVHDFSGDFDIYAWVTSPTVGNNGVIYSKADSLGGIGLSISLESSGSNFYVYARMRNTSGSTKSFSTNGIKYVAAQKPCCIRLRRIGETIDLWLVNGTEATPFGDPDNTNTNGGGSFNSTKQATIGSNGATFSGNNVLTVSNKMTYGRLNSLRIYCGGTLDLDSAEQIVSSRPIPLIMKLAGSVWKIESNVDKKRLYVKGFGKLIIDTIVSSDLMTSGATSSEYYHGGASRTGTAFSNCYPTEIIQAIFGKINAIYQSGTPNPSYRLSIRNLTGYSATINSYNAQGNLLEIINQLTMVTSNIFSFYISPRGVCIIEIPNKDFTSKLKFKNGVYQVTADGFDDSNCVNDLYVFSNAGGNFAFVHTKDQTSVNAIGLYSKRAMTPQITDAVAVGLFKSNILSTYSTINRRYTIEAPFLLDFVRENFKIQIENDIKFPADIQTTVKSITWKYPESRTLIETGDYLLDAFDLEKVSAETINNMFSQKAIYG